MADLLSGPRARLKSAAHLRDCAGRSAFASSLGYFGRLRAPRPEQALKTGATVFFALVRGARSLPEGRSLHVALARRAGARSLRAPASQGSSLGSLGRLLAMRKLKTDGSSLLFAL